jgi:hypothetical protein
MRKLSLIVVTLSFLVIAGRASAYAQVTDTIEADVPFDFRVGEMSLPAGKYTIKRLDSVSEGVMEIRGADGHKVRVFLTENAQAAREPHQTEIIFDRAGDRLFLSEIFEKGDRFGVEVPKSRAEKRLEKEGVMIQSRSVAVPAQDSIDARD